MPENETRGEQFKRLQSELSGGHFSPSARLAFATLVHDPAFAEHILGLEQKVAQDDPQFDATDYAHPAWWRGHDHTTAVICQEVHKILDGKDDGKGGNNEPWGATRRRLVALVDQLTAASQKLAETEKRVRELEGEVEAWKRRAPNAFTAGEQWDTTNEAEGR